MTRWWTDESFINTPLDDATAIDTDSATWLTAILADPVADTFCFPNGSDEVGGADSTTVYEFNFDDPGVGTNSITLDIGIDFPGHSGDTTIEIPWKDEWVVSPGDQHVALIFKSDATIGSIDYVTGDVLSFQGLDMDAFTAHSAELDNILTQTGEGLGSGEIAMLPVLTGLIRPSEVDAINNGDIDHFPHALAFILPNDLTDTTSRYPSDRSDGSGTGMPPAGVYARLPFDLDLSTFGLDQWGMATAKTLKIYGMTLRDCGGSMAIWIQSTADGVTEYSITPSTLPRELLEQLLFLEEAPTGGGADPGGGDDGGGDTDSGTPLVAHVRVDPTGNITFQGTNAPTTTPYVPDMTQIILSMGWGATSGFYSFPSNGDGGTALWNAYMDAIVNPNAYGTITLVYQALGGGLAKISALSLGTGSIAIELQNISIQDLASSTRQHIGGPTGTTLVPSTNTDLNWIDAGDGGVGSLIDTTTENAPTWVADGRYAVTVAFICSLL